ALKLRALYKTDIARTGMGVAVRSVSGLPLAAKALFVAAAAHNRPHGVVWYIVPGDGDIEQTLEDVRFFLSALEGLTSTAVERAILPFPSHEVDPDRGLSPHFGVASARPGACPAVAKV